MFQAREALATLPEEEQQAVLKYFYVRDAKMSLASYLLKHLAISKVCQVPWSQSVISKKEHGKPCYNMPPNRTLPKNARPIEFNVSHQAGVVVLFASRSPECAVGVDVVCVNERNDYATIDKEGFNGWVDIHADVFAPSEVDFLKHDGLSLEVITEMNIEGESYLAAVAQCQRRHEVMKWTSPSGESLEMDSNTIIEAKLRRFYALWCLREAYVKMTGEALLAPWIRELEFRSFDVPCELPSKYEDTLHPGETSDKFEIFLKGERITNIAVELTTLGTKYMVASVIKYDDPWQGPGDEYEMKLDFPAIEPVDLERDILPVARSKTAVEGWGLGF